MAISTRQTARASTSNADVQLLRTRKTPQRHSQRPDQQLPVPPKGKNYYYPEKIIKHVVIDGWRHFEVKWEGYSAEHNTREPEENFDGAIQMLNEYCIKAKICETTIKERVGAFIQPGHCYNEKLHKDINQVIKRILTIRCTIPSSIPVLRLRFSRDKPVFIDSDAIYLYVSAKHCYVILHCNQRSLIADGDNSYCKYTSVQEELRSIFGVNCQSTSFNHQKQRDHCAASTVAISQEFMRLYKSGEVWPKHLKIAVPSYHKLVDEFYGPGGGDSEPLKKENFGRPANICDCGWSTIDSNRRGLSLHKKFHCVLRK